MKKIWKIFIALCTMALVSLAAATAETGKQEAKRNNLDARYNHLDCRVNLVKEQADNIANYIVIDGLSEKKEKLTSDMTTIKGYADEGKVKEFNSFVTTTLIDDVKALQESIKGIRGGVKNIRGANRTAIRATWRESVSAFADCNKNSKRDIVSSRSNFVKEQVNEWNNAIAKMKEKGIDTSELEGIVDEASQLTTLLDEATSAATDEQFKDKVNEARDLHLHLWARFHIAKLNAYLDTIEAKAKEAGMQDKVTEIRNLLSEASEKAQPGKIYADGDFKETWDIIKQAADKLKELGNALKGR